MSDHSMQLRDEDKDNDQASVPASHAEETFYRYWPTNFEERYPPPNPAIYDEFDRKYPPDRFGEEASDNARVWKLYHDRADEKDQDRLASWHDSLNVLLIFAGLFSAVVTTFVVELSSSLQPDHSQYTVAILLAMATSNGSPLSQTTLEQLNPASFSADRAARWINGLWLISLTISLLVSLFAILAKQWLGEYSSRMRAHAGSHRLWAHRHITFSAGLNRWQMDAFIATLPLMLHGSLALFLSGLVVWLFEINTDIGITVLILCAACTAFYVACTIMPLFYGDCPTATPFLRLAYRMWSIALNTATLILRTADSHIQRMFQLKEDAKRQINFSWKPHAAAFDEVIVMNGRAQLLDEEVLKWVVTSLPATEEVIVGLDAIGALEHVHRFEVASGHLSSTGEDTESFHPLDDPWVLSVATQRFERLTTGLAHTASDLSVARFIRTALALNHDWEPNRPSFPLIRSDVWQPRNSYDIRLLLLAYPFAYGICDMWKEAANDITSWLLRPLHDKTSQDLIPSELPVTPQTVKIMLWTWRRHYDAIGDFFELAPKFRADMIDIWSIPALAGLSWVLDRDLSPDSAGDALLSILSIVIETTIAGKREAATWSPPDHSNDWRLRAMYAWGFALQNTNLLGIAPPNQRLVIAAFSDALSRCDRQLTPISPRMPLLQLGECLSYIGSDDFLRHDWQLEHKAIEAAAFLIESLLAPPSSEWRTMAHHDHGDWSPTLSRVLRNAFSIPNLAWVLSQTAAFLSAGLAVGTKAAPFDHDLHQATVIQVLESHATLEDFLNMGRINILSRTNRFGSVECTSTWRQMRIVSLAFPPSWNEPVPFVACDLVSQLCVLHRMRDHLHPDLSRKLPDMLEELLGDEHGKRIIGRFAKVRLFLAQHGREISHDWWKRISEALCKPVEQGEMSQSCFSGPNIVQEWVASPEHPDAKAFVAAVEATDPCQRCPSNVVFSGQAGPVHKVTRQPVPVQASLDSANNADGPARVAWPYRIWRRGESKHQTPNHSDP